MDLLGHLQDLHRFPGQLIWSSGRDMEEDELRQLHDQEHDDSLLPFCVPHEHTPLGVIYEH